MLSIAGTDPSGGAGIQADIKTISATGSYAASVITALVAQNTQVVKSIFEISPEFLIQQLDAVFSDLAIKAIKIGMLHNSEIINLIADYLININYKNYIILDPVMFAKNGSALLHPSAITALKTKLLPLATLITPNIPEAEILLDSKIKIDSCDQMEFAAKKLSQKYNINILLKGGHIKNNKDNLSSDILYFKNNNNFIWFHADKIKTNNTHGTGCSLSSAIASYLAQEFSLEKSIELAKNYLTHAILSGSRFKIAQGCGPVDHFYYLRNSWESTNSTFGGFPVAPFLCLHEKKP